MAASAPRGTLDGWAVTSFSGAGLTHDCYERGTGPGVVLIPEIPGITPEVLGLAERLVEGGFTVVIPSPFGPPGAEKASGSMVRSVLRLCVSAEFRAFALNSARPITGFLRAVAADLAARTPGHGVGIIGMCFTGGFALAAAVDDSILAAVASQPVVPFPISNRHRADPGMSQGELTQVAARMQSGELCAMGLRFTQDGTAPEARFRTLSAALGEAFEVITLDSDEGNSEGYLTDAHSVLTAEVRTDPPNSAYDARERVLAFLTKRLL